MKYEITRGKRYAKLIAVDGHTKSAVAFYDYENNVWLNAASWVKPARTEFKAPMDVKALIAVQP